MKWIFLSLIYAALLAFMANVDLFNDSGLFFTYGKNLAQTGIYGLVPGIPDMGREPGYGFFLSLIFRLGLSDLKWMVFFQSLLFFWVFWVLSFKSFFTGKDRYIYFFLSVFSPTLAGAATVIYSETLAISLMGLFLITLYKSIDISSSRPLRRWNILLAALSYSALILTKSYFQYSPYFLIIFSIYFLVKKNRIVASTLVIIAITGLFGNFLWNQRNHQVMGPQYTQFRLDNALAGKILRVESFNLPEELPVSLAAAIGTNFCQRHYSHEQCMKYDFQEADILGAETYKKYIEEFPKSRKEAGVALRKDLIRHAFRHPFLQLFGNFLETVRMSFFETTQKSLRGQWLNSLGSAWHFCGSIILFSFAVFGIRNKFFEIKKGPDKKYEFLLLALFFIFYHWLTMSQITNGVRYIFSVIPCIYIFATYGISGSLRSPKPQ